MVWWPGTVLDEQEQAGRVVAGIQTPCHSRRARRLVRNKLLQAVWDIEHSPVPMVLQSICQHNCSEKRASPPAPKPALPQGTHSPSLQVQQGHAPTPKTAVGGRSVSTE